MKNKKTFFTIITMAIFSFTIACSDDDDKIDPQIEILFETLTCHPDYSYGKKHEIVGEWQLVSYRRYEIEDEANDFSCDYILYHFFSNQKVIITSSIDYEWMGEYDYKYSILDNCPLCLPYKNLQLGDSGWYCEISESTMRLWDSDNRISKYLIRKR